MTVIQSSLTEEERPLYVTYRGKLYDIHEFADKHPGGRKVLDKVAGGDIDQFMDGRSRIMGVKHEHSDAAVAMLQRYSMDQIFEKDPMIDKEGAMLRDVGSLGEHYWRWIHEPYPGTLRLFDSDFLERLTNTKWWVIPLVWMPMVIFFASSSLVQFCSQHGPSKGFALATSLFMLGTLAWTLLEYTLHRFVFHWKPDPHSKKQITLHFLIHGLHHKTPMDGDRLVFPPTPAVPIVGFFYAVYSSILPWPAFCAFGAGKLFGYVVYDVLHYYLHHGAPRPRSNLHYRKVYHHNHHFKDFDASYGISTNLWDVAFDTIGSGPL